MDFTEIMRNGISFTEVMKNGVSLWRKFITMLGLSPAYKQPVPDKVLGDADLNMVGGHSEAINGEVVHAECQSVTVTGKNLFDMDKIFRDAATDQYPLTIDADGYYILQNRALYNRYNSSAGGLPVSTNPNMVYTISCVGCGSNSSSTTVALSLYAMYEDDTSETLVVVRANGNVPKYYAGTTDPTKNVKYFFASYGNSQRLKIKDILIEQHAAATAYTPYHDPITYQLPYIEQDSWGIGDVHNERNFKDGKRIKRVARIDLGSLNWEWGASWGRPIAKLSEHTFFNGYTIVPSGLMCAEMTICSYAKQVNRGLYGWNNGGTHTIYARDNAVKSADDIPDFVDSVRGIYLYYVVDTPIETSLDQPPIHLSVSDGDTVTFNNAAQFDVPNETIYKVKE